MVRRRQDSSDAETLGAETATITELGMINPLSGLTRSTATHLKFRSQLIPRTVFSISARRSFKIASLRCKSSFGMMIT